jgi:hypothetical protein
MVKPAVKTLRLLAERRDIEKLRRKLGTDLPAVEDPESP